MDNNGNPNIFHINALEGLATQMNIHIESLAPHITEQQMAKDELRDGLAEWERAELKQARNAFE